MSDADRVSAHEVLKGFGRNDNLAMPLIEAWAWLISHYTSEKKPKYEVYTRLFSDFKDANPVPCTWYPEEDDDVNGLVTDPQMEEAQELTRTRQKFGRDVLETLMPECKHQAVVIEMPVIDEDDVPVRILLLDDAAMFYRSDAGITSMVPDKPLPDGRYTTQANGIARARDVLIQDGQVVVDGERFSQWYFFEANHLV